MFLKNSLQCLKNVLLPSMDYNYKNSYRCQLADCFNLIFFYFILKHLTPFVDRCAVKPFAVGRAAFATFAVNTGGQFV